MTDRPSSQAALSDRLARAEADVEQARERVSSAVRALRDELARRSDRPHALVRHPTEYIKQHPVRCLLGALALGFVVGKIARRA